MLEKLSIENYATFIILELDTPYLQNLLISSEYDFVSLKNVPHLVSLSLVSTMEGVDPLHWKESYVGEFFRSLVSLQKLELDGFNLKSVTAEEAIRGTPMTLHYLKELRLTRMCFMEMDNDLVWYDF